ncbi:uncharacterized protein LOC133927616 [Phragmites australis]|uniref:uncharacterized protein LOC133927616 n=1 Tax=Phragmites australis TaxID=29695 RepID=UPI002D786C5D|nr:uncharacterized protein LOC133927616 [Phragmites australis]
MAWGTVNQVDETPMESIPVIRDYPNVFPEELPGKTIPTAILTRIMRLALPPNAKVTGDAKDAMDRSVKEFAAAVTWTAVQECRRDRRVTVTGDDLIVAMGSLGLGDYVGPLRAYLRRYRETVGVMPRGRQTVLLPAPAAMMTVEVEMQPPPPETSLALSLGLQPPQDVTELGLDADVYAVWPGAAGAGTSRMPPAGGEE